MRLFLLAILIAASHAVSADESRLAAATAAFDNADYATAVSLLESAGSANDGACAECEHLLGRSYGRLAQQSSWRQAVQFAKKSRTAFENAVDLDPLNTGALQDLIEFYRKAPGFLGGDASKADRLEQRLHELQTDTTS